MLAHAAFAAVHIHDALGVALQLAVHVIEVRRMPGICLGMAEEGFSCEEIITWYYSGVEVID